MGSSQLQLLYSYPFYLRIELFAFWTLFSWLFLKPFIVWLLLSSIFIIFHISFLLKLHPSCIKITTYTQSTYWNWGSAVCGTVHTLSTSGWFWPWLSLGWSTSCYPICMSQVSVDAMLMIHTTASRSLASYFTHCEHCSQKLTIFHCNTAGDTSRICYKRKQTEK